MPEPDITADPVAAVIPPAMRYQICHPPEQIGVGGPRWIKLKDAGYATHRRALRSGGLDRPRLDAIPIIACLDVVETKGAETPGNLFDATLVLVKIGQAVMRVEARPGVQERCPELGILIMIVEHRRQPKPMPAGLGKPAVGREVPQQAVHRPENIDDSPNQAQREMRISAYQKRPQPLADRRHVGGVVTIMVDDQCAPWPDEGS